MLRFNSLYRNILICLISYEKDIYLLLKDLVYTLDEALSITNIVDYCPNGLQVEGRAHVNNVVTGVTASLALIEAAIELNADAILVHHGYFWKGENQAIVGMKKERIKQLVLHDISLLAYHLPLDVHPTLGNNAQLGKLLNIQDVHALANIKPQGVVMGGTLAAPLSHAQLSSRLCNILQREVVSIGNKDGIESLAWCTGGGQNFIDAVASLHINGKPIDAFISGEISEQTTHSAIEQNIDFFAAGHHATERYGVKALGEWLQQEYQLNVQFVDMPNPA